MILCQSSEYHTEHGECPQTRRSELPLYHMNCRQLSKTQMQNDQIIYQYLSISKIILIGRVIAYEKGISPRGMAVLNAKVQDCTGRCNISFYFRPEIEKVCQRRDYVKIAVAVKCGGLVYRPQINMMSHSVVLLTDFNQLTEHYLQCIKTQLHSEN